MRNCFSSQQFLKGWLCFSYKFAAGVKNPAANSFFFIILFETEDNNHRFNLPPLPDPVTSEEPTPSVPIKGTPHTGKCRCFFVRSQLCLSAHGSGISPSPRGSRRAASRRKYHCEGSSGHGRSHCRWYCTLKDYPLKTSSRPHASSQDLANRVCRFLVPTLSERSHPMF